MRPSTLVLVAICLLAANATGRAETLFGVTENQTLVSWDSAAPGALLSGVSISGLANNEQLRGIDFRPATGQLYGLGSFNTLYTIDTSTGMATGVGPTGLPLDGSSFGFDFNPQIDKIRVVSDTNKNYVLDPATGAATMVTSLFYDTGDANENQDPSVVHSAYTNSVANAPSTQLFGIDTGLDLLVKQANSAGTLTSVGLVGTDITDVGGFDISGATGVAYAVIKNATLAKSTFWTIDLGLGSGVGGAEIGGGAIITGLAVAPVPEPTAGLLAFSAVLIAVARRRSRLV